MKIGISLPQMGLDSSPEAIVQVAQEAEKLDFASVWVGERLLRPRGRVWYGGREGVPIPESQKVSYEPLETLTYVAAKTERIQLGTSVINLFFQSPTILGRRLATLDQFSGGRLLVGVGQGWMKEEFDATNTPWKRRGSGAEEYITALHAIWGADPVHHEGRFYHIPESDMNPKPVQPGGPPLLFGTSNASSVARAARVADGLNPVLFSWDMAEKLFQDFFAQVRQAGRYPDRMINVVRVNGGIHAQALPATRPPLVGSLEQIHEDLQRLATLHVGHVFYDLTSIPVMERLPLLEKLRKTAE